MQEFIIQNFGPIVNANGESLEIDKVTVFCGKQGAGKSSIAKLISVFFWLEKSLVRGDVSEKDISAEDAFKEKYCSYHNIQNYFKKDTYLYFKGSKLIFEYRNGVLKVTEQKRVKNFARPQVMYIPSERNLMTAIEDADKIRNLPSSLSTLLSEYYRALKSAQKPISLPVDGYKVSYDDSTKTAWLSDKNFKIKMTEAASGFQSMAPMLVVSRYLLNKIRAGKKGASLGDASEIERSSLLDKVAKILNDKSLSEEERKKQMNLLLNYSFNSRLVNIVEEPEQNLYPDSQREVLFELLKINYEWMPNQLVLTTHSPYMLNYLSLAVKAGILKEKMWRRPNRSELLAKLEPIVPRSSAVNPKGLNIYEITADGEIRKLGNYDGIPSDSNFLNSALSQTNDMFDKLLDIEDEVGK